MVCLAQYIVDQAVIEEFYGVGGRGLQVVEVAQQIGVATLIDAQGLWELVLIDFERGLQHRSSLSRAYLRMTFLVNPAFFLVSVNPSLKARRKFTASSRLRSCRGDR